MTFLEDGRQNTTLHKKLNACRGARHDGGWLRHDDVRRDWRGRARYGHGERPSRGGRLHDAWQLRDGVLRHARDVRQPCGDDALRLRVRSCLPSDQMMKVCKSYAIRLTDC